MINLIPQSAKKKLRLEYWSRVLIVWCGTWSIALVLGTIMLVPAYGLITYQIVAYKDSALVAAEKVADYENAAKALRQGSQQALLIVEEAEMGLFTDYLKLFQNSQGENISLTKIELRRQKVLVEQIVVSGIATNRVSLAAYRDRLLADDRIDSVDLPISNLAQDKDIEFTFTITVRNNIES